MVEFAVTFTGAEAKTKGDTRTKGGIMGMA